jgi:hypothetical protein
MNETERVQELIGHLDPAHEETVPVPMSLADEITRLPSQSRTTKKTVSDFRRPGVMRRAIGIAAAVAMLAGVATVGEIWVDNATVATASTPPVLQHKSAAEALGDSASVLRELASRAEVQGRDVGDGELSYIKTSGWYLGTRVDGDNVKSAVFTTTTETWRHPDGSGRQKTTVDYDEPSGLSMRNRLKNKLSEWRAEEHDDIVGPGSIAAMYSQEPSTDAGILRRQIAESHPENLGVTEVLVGVGDLYRERPLDGAQRAAVLRMLAEERDLYFLGEIKDRLGRPGLGFAADSTGPGLPTRYEVMFDPSSGQLLDAEQILTSSAGALNVPIPSVLSYTLFENSGWVSATSVRP